MYLYCVLLLEDLDNSKDSYSSSFFCCLEQDIPKLPVSELMHCEELQGFLSSYIIETFFIYPPQSCSFLLVPHFPAAEEPVKFGVFLICKNYFLVMFRQSILPCCCACDWPIYKHTFCHGCYFSLMFSREGKKNPLLVPFHCGTQETWEFACKV